MTVTTGLSVGWGDTYPAWRILALDRHHRVQVRPLPAVRDADRANWFVEMNNADNGTWINIGLTLRSQVLAYGPAA